jgi:hypothetical protein
MLKAVEVRVMFTCRDRIRAIAPIRTSGGTLTFTSYLSLMELAEAIDAAIAPIRTGKGMYLKVRKRHRWTLTFTSPYLSLMENQKANEQKISRLLSDLDGCLIEDVDVHMEFIYPPVLTRPRKPKSPLPACRCKKFPCKHTPSMGTWNEQEAKHTRQQATERQRWSTAKRATRLHTRMDNSKKS